VPEDLFPWFRMLSDLPGPPLDGAAFFENAHPVELEIGCGRGLFLFTASQTCPDRNFLGIDFDYKEAKRAAERLRKRAIPNARILGGDANVLLQKYVTDGSVSAVHVYFPDPWWKRRHHKRRIWTPAFVRECARVLKVGGDLHGWTDVEEYFQAYQPLVSSHPALEELPPPAERAPEHDMDYHTSFERKKRKAGLPIYRAHWRRIAGSHEWP
jgi:tRNA (guanine-N7-)-methyltransferase